MITIHTHTHCLQYSQFVQIVLQGLSRIRVFFSDHDADNLEKLLMADYNMREEKKSNVLNSLR